MIHLLFYSAAPEEAPVVQEDPEDARSLDPVAGLEAVPDHPHVLHGGPQRAAPAAEVHAAAHALRGGLLG